MKSPGTETGAVFPEEFGRLINREQSPPLARFRLLKAPHIGTLSCPRSRRSDLRRFDYAYLKWPTWVLGIWVGLSCR
jgi:hypothetical protein